MAAAAKPLVRRDEQIRQDVQFELKGDPKITSPDIAIAVKDGVVTLSGFTSSYWEKDAAEKAAKRVYGVRGIANDIEVKLFASRTDPEIARDCIHELENHIAIPSDKIKVTVRSGWVTLEGTVDWQFQKTLAESAVKKLRGVLGITNNIQLKQQASPAEVKSKIEEALRRSAELDARRITVEADGGTVKLYGSVRSWAEKSEAERAAWSTRGTVRVENYISVIP
jgi:osmotically-inducible protein OsmY